MQIIKKKNGRSYFQPLGGGGFPLGPEDAHLEDCVYRAYLAGRCHPYRQGTSAPGGALGAGAGGGAAPPLHPLPGGWDMTPIEVAEEFLRRLKKRVKPGTWKIRRSDLLGGTGLVTRFGADDWAGWWRFWDWIDGEAWETYKPNSIKSFVATAKALVAWAKKAGIRIPDFAEGQREKLTTKQKEEAPHLADVPWTPFIPAALRDIDVFSHERWSDHYPVALRMMTYHGINPVDIYAVGWDCIEWDRNGLGAFYSNRRRKTFEILDVPLAPPVVEDLRRIHRGETEGSIFTEMPQTNQGLDSRFRTVRKALRIPKQPHRQNGHQRFRHTFASLVDDLVLPNQMKVDRKYSRRLMGHKRNGGDDAESMDVYTSVGDERTRIIVDALAEFILTQ